MTVEATYAEKLKDPRWQKKRLQIFERDEWTCQLCYDDQSSLVVHHRRYVSGMEPWDYPNELLITLCESCHDEERANMQEAIALIVEALKEKFLGPHVHDLALGIHKLECQHLPGVVASVYSWAFGDAEIQRELTNRYFTHLQKKHGGK